MFECEMKTETLALVIAFYRTRQLLWKQNYGRIFSGFVGISLSILVANDHIVLCLFIIWFTTAFAERPGGTHGMRKLTQPDSFLPFATLADARTEALS